MDDTIAWSTLSESQFFERKSALYQGGGSTRPRRVENVVADILDVLSAMANADGGELVIGIEDDGLATGVPHSDAHVRAMCAAPGRRDLVRPPLHFDVRDTISPEGIRLLHFRVVPSGAVHRLADGRCLLRIRDANIPLTARQVPGLETTMPQRQAEGDIPERASLHDLDYALAARLPGDGDVRERLLAARLLADRNGAPAPCLAALLLFGKSPARWHPCCGVSFVRWAGEDDPQPVARFEITGALADLPGRVFEAVQAHIPRREQFPFGALSAYPASAWQEAVVNAIAHRDYGIRDRDTEVWLFDDRLEVRSPGLPPRPVTANRLNRQRGFHLARNPRLFHAMVALGLIREVGRGEVSMRRAMGREALGAPQFDRVDGRVFRVTLSARSLYSEVLIRWLDRFAGLHLTDDQKRLLAYARLHGYRFTVGQFCRLVDVPASVATDVVRDLVRKGVARSVNRSDDFYRVVEPFYAPSDVSVFLVPALARRDCVTNRDVRRGLGLRRRTARRLLRLWVDDGWLTRVGDGPQTVYVPGPRFQRSQDDGLSQCDGADRG